MFRSRSYFYVALFLLNTVCGLPNSKVYEYSSVTQVFENDQTQTLRPFQSRANVKIDLLKQESFNKLYSIQVDNCSPVSCDADATDFLVSFENETIRNIYGKLDNSSEWSIGLAIISLLQPRMDVPRIHVPGVCYSNNEKIDEKTTIRELKFCKYGKQNSIVPALSLLSKYEQKVIYETQNEKFIGLTAEESYSLSFPLYDKATTKIIATHILKEKSQEQSTSNHRCDENLDVNGCLKKIAEAKKYKFISESGEKLLTAFILDRFHHVNAPSETSKCVLGTTKDLQKLNAYATKEATKMFLKKIKLAQRATETELLSCLTLPENKENLDSLASLLAMSGTVDAHNAMKKFLSKDNTNHEVFWNAYLTVLVHSPSVNLTVIEDVLNILSVSDPVDETLATSAASLLRRHCLKIAGCEDRSGPTKQLISVFETKFKECKSDECVLTMIQSFANLRTFHLIPLVRPYLCSDKMFSEEVLRLLKVLHPAYWSKKDILPHLLRIYIDNCPKPQDQTSRTLAAELLLMSYEDKRIVVENLLKSVNLTNNNDREIYSYVVAKIKQMATVDDRIREAFNEFESKTLFFNYNTLASNAESTVYKNDFVELDSHHVTYELDMLFSKSILKRSSANVKLESYDSSPSLLLSFGLFSEGLESVASSLGASEGNEPAKDEPVTPTAGMRLALFDNEQNPVTFFTGEGELMSAVWGASGDQMTAFGSTFLVNDLRNSLPLLNGYTLNIDIQSALSLKLSGSVEVSIWYRTSHTVVANEGSFVLDGKICLHSSNGKTVFKNELGLSTELGVNFITDTDFYSNPFKMCLQMDQNQFSIKYKANHKLFNLEDSNGKKSAQNWKRTNERRIQGRSYVTLPKNFKSCSALDSQQ